MHLGECSIYGYVAYHGSPRLRDGKPCTSIYVRCELEQNVADVSAVSSNGAEYASVIKRLNNQDITVVSFYVVLLPTLWGARASS